MIRHRSSNGASRDRGSLPPIGKHYDASQDGGPPAKGMGRQLSQGPKLAPRATEESGSHRSRSHGQRNLDEARAEAARGYEDVSQRRRGQSRSRALSPLEGGHLAEGMAAEQQRAKGPAVGALSLLKKRRPPPTVTLQRLSPEPVSGLPAPTRPLPRAAVQSAAPVEPRPAPVAVHSRPAVTAEAPLPGRTRRPTDFGPDAYPAGVPPGGFGEGEAAPESLVLVKCHCCERSFNENAFARHEKICNKPGRVTKVFDPMKQAMPQEAQALKKAAEREVKKSKKAAPPARTGKMPTWKAKSEQLRSALQNARMVSEYKRQGKDLRDLPPPAATAEELDDRIPCPHCGRKFGQTQAERHIPKCKETKAKAGPLLRAGAAGGGRPPKGR